MADVEEQKEKARIRAREWYRQNKERALANVRKYRAENGQAISDRKKKYRAENRDLIRADQANRYRNDAEKYKEKSRLQRKNNRTATNAYSRNRRAREQAAEGSHTGEEIKALLVKQSGKCPYCRASIKAAFHVDHVVALRNGGSNWISNIQLLCPTCNLRKNARDPVEFIQSMGMLI
ncbi:HNH endonuclease [Burkholderia cenocepacia]|uniref:HNH endonuclease n=1 Tax=Burkholderia cenocepacia TaxID=95486 RepID=UPI0026566F14|nr:HNH endonuclease [Burkholderia cenocepacia]MDN7658440.1 HNH endonuclease [Burkholderia cenocepacia]